MPRTWPRYQCYSVVTNRETNHQIRIGTAGFSYKDWLGNFYPQFCSQKDFLRFYASKFPTVELDVTFYRIPSASTVEKWVASTPPNFSFSAKFPRTVTHEGDLARRLEQAEVFLEAITGLGEKMGALLLQFPYAFKPDSRPILLALLDLVPKAIPLAVEFRHKGWLTDDTFDLLRKRNAALCLVDHCWMPRLRVRTADFAYIRFLGDHRQLEEDYSYVRLERQEELEWWRDLMEELANDRGIIYGYFNNHYSGHAPTTAYRLMDLLGIGD